MLRAKFLPGSFAWAFTLLWLVLLSAPLWAQVGTSTLSWTAVTTNVDGTAATITEYRIYRSSVDSVGPYTQIDSVPGGTVNYSDSGLFNGQYFYYVTAVNSYGNESAPSNWDDVVIALGGSNDPPVPDAPTNLVVQ